ncbi:hypothetical protein MPTK2_3g12990 [Marchantia polymorpha subsp. ruderalis]
MIRRRLLRPRGGGGGGVAKSSVPLISGIKWRGEVVENVTAECGATEQQQQLQEPVCWSCKSDRIYGRGLMVLMVLMR